MIKSQQKNMSFCRDGKIDATTKVKRVDSANSQALRHSLLLQQISKVVLDFILIFYSF